jgi:DNA-binding IscR family transcriptional regulator
MPSRDTDEIRVKEILDAVRAPHKGYEMFEERTPPVPRIDEVMKEIDSAMTGALDGLTLKDLIVSGKECAQELDEKGSESAPIA